METKPMHRETILAAALIAAAPAAVAVEPSPARAEGRAGPPPRVYRLENGLTFIAREEAARDLVAVCAFVRTGCRNETKETSGLSHYYEHLLFRGGSKLQKELEFRKAMQVLGEESGGYTSDDYTCYGFTVPSGKTDEALWRFADFLFGLQLTEERVARERQVVLEEMSMNYKDSASGRALLALHRLAFESHPYRVPPIGTEEAIRAATLETFRTFYEERYAPENVVIAAVGRFDADALAARVRELFGPVPRAGKLVEPHVVEAPRTAYRESVEGMKVQTSTVYLGWQGVSALDPAQPVLDVLASLLAGGRSARLEQALREREPLALSAFAWAPSRLDPGLFYIGADMDPKNEQKVVETVFAELRRIAREGVPESELQAVKERMAAAHAFAQETYFARAERLCFFGMLGAIAMEPVEQDLFRRVTSDDLRRLVAERLSGRQCSLALVRPEGLPGTTFAPVAETYAELAPKAAAGSGAPPETATQATLDNGFAVVCERSAGSATVAIQMHVRGGLLLEDASAAGVAQLCARSLLKGTQSLGAEELAARIDALGVRLDAAAHEDYTALSLQAPRDRFEEGLDLLADVFLHPRFDATEVAKAREEQVTAIRAVEDDAFAQTNQAFAAELYARGPYKRPVLGYAETVATLDASALRAYHARAFTSKNTVVALVGDVDPALFVAAARARFGGVPAGEAPKLPELPAETAVTAKVRSIVRPDRSQVTLDLGRATIPVTDEDYLALQLAARVLGHRLFFKYVYEEGMAYRMWTYLTPRLGPGAFVFEVGVAKESFAKARAGLEGELRDFLARPLAPKDLQTAKASAIQGFLLGQQTPARRAATLAFYEAVGLGHRFALRYPEMVEALTAEDVKRAAAEHLNADALTLVTVGPVDASKP